ncbi:MAG: Tol-Pal system protein TolB [Alphaproteobacteria bacterium]|nr:Tol-Pal system protein TolB [Alphaproteobacteria bacterium]MDE2493634.1 Tol-Pal system protein TolB [Alphaproteobacteria bacterium]MDE2500970.1 Tol-Pal system protein TolB [Alphaproteobacteria bacterium]
MRKLGPTILAALAVLLGGLMPASAALKVDVNQANIQPLPIAIPDFVPGAPADVAAGQNIAKVVRADLDRSGLFKALDPKSYIDKITNINVAPNFSNWRIITAQGLVTGSAAMQPDGRLRVDFRLWDVYGEQQMLGLQYFTQPANWRRIAHMISDAIYQRITGETGYFDTRIVFISESGPPLSRKKRLAIMDEDGANPSFLTNGSYLVLTPRFNPTAQMIAYMSYIGRKPAVYLFDLESGRQEKLGDFPNMTFSPRFSPDGNKVVMSLEQGGNSDIYVMDLRTRAVTRLTYDPGIDTSPSYSPDGKQITFESDRGGSQQIYVMNADGSNQHRISFGEGRHGTPVWSPRGDLIAFTNITTSAIRIGVMRPDGSAERILSNGWEDEGPTWAPNGRVLMFTRTIEGGRGSQIWSIDVTGRNERRVATPGDASDPAWSPLIQ